MHGIRVMYLEVDTFQGQPDLIVLVLVIWVHIAADVA